MPYKPFKRLDHRDVTPSYEDAGLFKNKICRLKVDLLPEVFCNHRNDIVITALVQGSIRISVMFAGRRTVEAATIIASLRVLRARLLELAAARGISDPDLTSTRLPLHIEGAWRPRFQRDENGWETRSYHLIAARWAVMNEKGDKLSFGEPPITDGPIPFDSILPPAKASRA